MKNKNRTQQAQKVTWVGFFTNLILSSAKLAAGILGNSAAMVADAVHSISDFITDVIVLAFVKYSDKESDEGHRYGHGKYETFATLLISLALFIVGVGIFINGAKSIYAAIQGEVLGQPSMIALVAAIVSIVSKEWLYQYTIKVGKSINNQAVVANAWHHRSDAFSSIGTMIGIGGAMFLGEKWHVLDPLAGLIVSLFIMNVAVKLGKPAVKELLEAALPEAVEKEIIEIVNQTPGVKDHRHLKTRKIGNNYAIDLHVKVDKDLSLEESHDIATAIEQSLFEKYGRKTHISIHVEPYKAAKAEV